MLRKSFLYCACLLAATLLFSQPALANSYWFDLLTRNVEKAAGFYGEMFDWKIESQGNDYWLIEKDGQQIGGIARLRVPLLDGPLWLAAFHVDDLKLAMSAVELVGGKVHRKPDTAPGLGNYAVMIDPQGAPFTLREGTHFVGGRRGYDRWSWSELWTDNPNQAMRFYRGVTGSRQSTLDISGGNYPVMLRNGNPWAGVIPIPFDEIKPIWMPYVKVRNLKAKLEQAESLGAQILLEPQPDVHDGRVALLLDPTGAAFLMQEDLK